jgi:hypothetical protein
LVVSTNHNDHWQIRPQAAVPECFLISYIDPVNLMKTDLTPTTSGAAASRQLSVLITLLALCGCASPPQPQRPAFQVPAGFSLTVSPHDPNKQPTVFQADELNVLINARWSRESATVLQQSRLSESAKYFALSMRAFQAVLGSGCKDLQLVSVSQSEAKLNASSQPRAAELWQVSACGQVETMPVSD